MKIRITVEREEQFDLRQFNFYCEETIEENPNSTEDELVSLCFEKLLDVYVKDYGYSIISLNSDDVDKVMYWIRQNIRDIKEVK